jgi:adenosylhomocysteine nucleosidase
MDTSPSKPKVAIVAALEREILPLVRGWRIHYREHEGRRYKFFEDANAVLVCGGIGAQPAARATHAAVELYGPDALVSAGFAGSLTSELRVGQTFVASRVIDASSGKIYQAECGTESGDGILLTVAEITGREEKRRMGERFHARALDMEAAAVAEVAARVHLPFMTVRAISDGVDEDLPPMQRFVQDDGSFAGGNFLGHVVLRPSLWPAIFRLARNARKAASTLSAALRHLVDSQSAGGFKVESGIAQINL